MSDLEESLITEEQAAALEDEHTSKPESLRPPVPPPGDVARAQMAGMAAIAPVLQGEKRPSLKVSRTSKGDGTYKTRLIGKRMDWIRRLIYLDGKPFDFSGRPYLDLLYNGGFKRMVLMFGRQSEKSSFLANQIIINSVIQPHYKTLYVSPSYLQTRQFSTGKLGPWISGSPLIKRYFTSTSTSSQVFEKGYLNGSMNYLRSAFLSADRARGISANTLCIDELQDILNSNIPVLEECLSHASDPIEILSGTPKTLDGPMETYFKQSSMCEWLVPCENHLPTHWNYLDEKCLGKEGPICNKCGHRIYPAYGKWVAFNSNREIFGARLSQLHVPWMWQKPEKWKELLWKHSNLSRGVFNNECLGLSFDSASKPVTRADLIACCTSLYPFRPFPDRFTKGMQVFAGIDWGSGDDGSGRSEKGRLKPASYTVLCLGGYIAPGKFHVFYYRRFEGAEVAPSHCVKEIAMAMRAFGASLAGVDYGFGWGVNEQLEEIFGADRVIRFQYVGAQKERKKYDDIGRKYQLNRTEVISDFISSIKRGEIIWPDFEQVKDYLRDIEHVYAEYNERSRMLQYDHRITEPDDAMHATILCREAADNFYSIQR